MKTFEQIKEERLVCENRIIDNARTMIEKHRDYYPTYSRYNEELNRSKKFLKDVDENVKLEIVVFARELYDEVSHSYIEYMRENSNSNVTFLDHFRSLIRHSECEYAEELFNVFYNNINLLKLIRYFGITEEDIKIFKEKRLDIVLRSIWNEYINQIYKTDIPLIADYEKLDKLFIYDLQHDDNSRLYSKYDLLLKIRNGDMSEVRTDEGRVYPLMTREEFIREYGDLEHINSMVLKRI